MILKNGKRLDGMGDSMPIGSIIEYNGTDIPDGWEQVVEQINSSTSVFSIDGKTYTTGSWSATDITKDLVSLFSDNGGFYLKDGKIYVSEDAQFTCIELSLYMKWLISWTADTGNRGIYVYHNGTRISTDYNSCPDSTSAWYSDTYTNILLVQPGDYFTISIVRGGQSDTINTQIERGHLKIRSLG
jgi:hypothetical protein